LTEPALHQLLAYVSTIARAPILKLQVERGIFCSGSGCGMLMRLQIRGCTMHPTKKPQKLVIERPELPHHQELLVARSWLQEIQ